MKKLIFIFCLAFHISLQAQDLAESDCQNILTNHVNIVEESEKIIKEVAVKKGEEITPYEILMLQKNLTNRYLDLSKTMDIYSREEKGCSPQIFADAIAIYDFTTLGKVAFKNSSLRRIIYSFTRSPKYQLTNLLKLYSFYTSDGVLIDFLEKLNLKKITLPENLIVNKDSRKGDKQFQTLTDVGLKGAKGVVSGAARVWGFISDHLKWRSGRLNNNQDVLNALKANLKPLDLIYEKRTYVLSNYTIPGHWGHVAVWLGTKEELIQAGVWDKDFFAPFRQQVEQGKNIVEIRKKGMDFVALEDFINLDEIAVTRIKNAQSNIEEILHNLSEQLDATYDFSFDAQTPDKLTCSEMIAYSFGDIHWPETNTLLQVSLRPDDVAILSVYDNSPAEFVLYFKGSKDRKAEQQSFEDWKKLFSTRADQELAYH